PLGARRPAPGGLRNDDGRAWLGRRRRSRLRPGRAPVSPLGPLVPHPLCLLPPLPPALGVEEVGQRGSGPDHKQRSRQAPSAHLINPGRECSVWPRLRWQEWLSQVPPPPPRRPCRRRRPLWAAAGASSWLATAGPSWAAG